MRPLRASFSVFFLLWTALSPVAAVRADAPPAAPAAAVSPSAAADKEIAQVRAEDAAFADTLAALKRDVEQLIPERLPDGAKLPQISPEAVAELDRRDHDLTDRWDKLRTSKKLKFWLPAYGGYVENRIALLGLNSTPASIAAAAKVLDGLEPRAAALDRDARAAPAPLSAEVKKPLQERLNALNAEGTELWESVHATALNIGDLGDAVQPVKTPTGFQEQRTRAGEMNETISPVQKRIADLSLLLQGVDVRLNGARPAGPTPETLATSKALRARMNPLLQDPFAHAQAQPNGGGASDGAVPAAAAGGALGLTIVASPAARKTLLDVAHVPALQTEDKPGAALPPVNAGVKGEDSHRLGTAEVNALRAKGLTRTVGDPARRAAYVYRQEGETCGIAAQVEVMADAGLVRADPAALKAKEDELYAKAVALGYYQGSAADPQRRYHGGTPGQHVGDLLDMHAAKHYAADPDDLFRAVKTGRMVIVSVETGVLWNSRRFRNTGHIVAITGAEVERSTGKLLGYYINDTTTLDAGRFVTAKQFHAAWSHWGGVYVEPL